MLEPHQRTLLFDILKPPEGHTLDGAIATTFTLDLLALLTAPVAFSLFDVDDHRELLDQNSLTLLESLRRYADKITVFCQVGYIGLPKIQFPQLEFLERSIVECRAANNGALFHPKIWLLRFVTEGGDISYRFACLTRNLTFDRCWDTVVTLEGPLRGAGRAANRPLADFVQALGGLALGPVPDLTSERISLMSEEVRRVDFQLPDGFDSYEFHPVGLAGRRSLPVDKRPGSLLAISPFISEGGLQRLTRNRQNSLLVSRPESLEESGCRLDAFEKLYVLAREADQETEEGTGSARIDLTRGLHAKCYVIDSGSKAHIFTGSANATEGGLSSNIEFVVELVGSRKRFGIEAMFKREENRTCIGDLLEEFKPQPKEPDEEELGFRAAIERTRHALAGVRFTGLVQGEGDHFDVELRPDVPASWSDVEVRVQCWPISVGRAKGQAVLPDQPAIHFKGLSFEALTSFVAFEVAIGEPARSEVFVLNVRLQGTPTDRRERLLRSFIKDRKRLIRFLLFLLADDAELADALGPAMERKNGAVGAAEAAQSNGALLETLLRSLHRSPERLDAVARLVEDVKSQADAAGLLPPGFDEIWNPIWAARREGRL